jgi:hypothetical protein
MPDHPVTDSSEDIEHSLGHLAYVTEEIEIALGMSMGPPRGTVALVVAARRVLRSHAALRERVAELEARAKVLEPYIEHAGDCAAHYAQAETCLSGPCDCELDALQEKHHAD